MRTNVAKAFKSLSQKKSANSEATPSAETGLSFSQQVKKRNERYLQRVAYKIGHERLRTNRRYQKFAKFLNSDTAQSKAQRSSHQGLIPIRNLLEGTKLQDASVDPIKFVQPGLSMQVRTNGQFLPKNNLQQFYISFAQGELNQTAYIEKDIDLHFNEVIPLLQSSRRVLANIFDESS